MAKRAVDMDATVRSEARFDAPIHKDSLWAFYRSLSACMSAGYPIQKALEFSANESEDPSVKETASGVLDELILRGKTFPEAIAKYPNMFSDTDRALIVVGDGNGSLDLVFRKIADNEEARELTRQRIRQAFLQPGVTLLATLLLIVVAPSFFVGHIRDFMAELGVPMPAMSRFIFAISDLFRPQIALPSLVLAVGLGYALREWSPLTFRSDLMRARLTKLGYLFPPIAVTLKAITHGHWARVLSLQLDAGVVTTKALLALIPSLKDPLFKRACRETLDGMEEDGLPLSQAMARTGYFDRLMIGVVSTGEETGNITQMLDFAANLYEDEFRMRLEMLEQFISPVLLCFCGLLAGVWTVAILLPMGQMIQSLT